MMKVLMGLLGLPPNLLIGILSSIVLAVSIALLLLRRSSSNGSSSVAPTKSSKELGDKSANSAPRPRFSLDEPHKPRVRILYGTQTGTAERFSKQLSKELVAKYGDSTKVEVMDLENYKPEDQLPREKLVLFCVATYGDGEPTDNAAEFHSWLVKEGEAVEAGDREPNLQGVMFAVFGLGNKQYEHFNAVGKKVFKHLKAMGATPLINRGDGDDDGCIDDDFDKWCAELYAALEKSDLVGNPNGQGATQEQPIEVPAYEVDVLPSSSMQVEAKPFPNGSGKDIHSPLWATITTLRELHGPGSDRACVHAEVTLSAAPGASSDSSKGKPLYEHGDHLAILPQNAPEVVSEVASKVLGLPLATMFSLRRPAAGTPGAALLAEPFPGPISLGTALAYLCDVLASPHRDALLALSTFATEPAEAAALKELGGVEGKARYSEYISKPHRSLLEVLRDHPSARPSLGAWFGCIAPRLQPRFYSISSSPKAHPSSMHVTCALVRDVMPTGRVHDGVCSSWLKRQLGAGEKDVLCASVPVPVFVRHSHFKLPASSSTPVVMIGPGTGLAPFRGFLQERAALQAAGSSLGPAHLFFGCRHPEHDYIYEEELQQHLQAGVISHLHTAFSRLNASKDYVQHHLQRQADAVWPLLAEQGGYLYVCGDAKQMARDVQRTLLTIAQEKLGGSSQEAEAWLEQLQQSGRYQRDVW